MGRGIKKRKASIREAVRLEGAEPLLGAQPFALCLVKTGILVLTGLMCESGKTLHCIIMAFFSLLGINPIGISAYL